MNYNFSSNITRGSKIESETSIQYLYSPINLSSQKKMEGRRIYIHEESFSHLAMQSIQAAKLIYSALCHATILKILHHNILMDGLRLSYISKESATSFLSIIENKWSDNISSALKKIGYRPQQPQYRHGFYPVLLASEKITATCYDVQYYTFATSYQAAKRMYMDVENIQHVKHNLFEKNKYSDLILIKGHSLALVDTEKGVGDKKAYLYKSIFDKCHTQQNEELNHVKYEIFNSALGTLTETMKITFCKTLLTSTFCNNILAISQNALKKGILKLSAI